MWQNVKSAGSEQLIFYCQSSRGKPSVGDIISSSSLVTMDPERYSHSLSSLISYQNSVLLGYNCKRRNYVMPSSLQTTVANVISNLEVDKFGKTQKFYVSLSKNSDAEGLREWVRKDENVTFLNRTQCCDKFKVVDRDDNIEIIQSVISKLPAQSVITFDEVPLTSKEERNKAFYDWSLLENKRPAEVTAVVCLQPFRIAPSFRQKTHSVVGPKDADVIELTNQYRNTNNILEFVNQLCQEKLSIEYTDTKVFSSHDVKGPEVTAISIDDQSHAADLRIWLCNQLQGELTCKPSQVKMIHVASTAELAKEVATGTAYEGSVISVNDFQGCETYIGVVFLGTDNNNLSQVLEMCSRAQYKLVLVVNLSNSLHEEVINTKAAITVLDINEVDKCPALLSATENGNATLVRQLLECRASVKVDNAEGFLLVRMAAEKGNVDIVSRLLEHGATLDPEERRRRRDPNNLSPLIIAVENANIAMVRVLLQYGASVKEWNRQKQTPLVIAASRGNKDICEELLKYKADTEVKDQDGNTPLIAAAETGKLAIVKLLLGKGATVRARNRLSLTPLAMAAQHGNVAIGKELLDQGADIEDTDNEGNTPLITATKFGHLAFVELLFVENANVKAQNKEGLTPFVMAVRQRRRALATFLLTNGVDLGEEVSVVYRARFVAFLKELERCRGTGAKSEEKSHFVLFSFLCIVSMTSYLIKAFLQSLPFWWK